MMKPKFLVILAVVLVVLAALSWTTSRTKYSTAEGGGFDSILQESLDVGEVESVKAWLGGSPDSLVELTRSGDGWVVASRWGWPAKEDQVKRLFDDLAGLKGERRASTEEVLADFQIDEEGGLHVVGLASGGSELFHLVVGKTATRGGAFVRQHGSHDVFLTPASLRSSFGVWGDEPQAPDPKRWIDLQVHKAERNEVDRIVLRDGANAVVLAKEFEESKVPEPDADAEEAGGEEATAAVPAVDRTKWTWKPDGDGEFDKNKVDGILGTLCSIYASDVADPANVADYGLDDGARVAELTFADGSTQTVFFGGPATDENRVYFRVGEDGSPAEIYKSTADRIFPDRSELSPTQES
jgi:hypothetical protein